MIYSTRSFNVVYTVDFQLEASDRMSICCHLGVVLFTTWSSDFWAPKEHQTYSPD